MPLLTVMALGVGWLIGARAAESVDPKQAELRATIEIGVRWNITAGSSKLTGHLLMTVDGRLEEPVHREYPGDPFVVLGYWSEEMKVHYRFVAKTFETDPNDDCHGLIFVHSDEQSITAPLRTGRDIFKLTDDDPALGDSYRFGLSIEPAPARNVPVTYRKPGCAKTVRPLPIFRTFHVAVSSRWVQDQSIPGETLSGQRSWSSLVPPWGDFAVRVDELGKGGMPFGPPAMGDHYKYSMKWSFGKPDTECRDPEAYFACVRDNRALLDSCVKLIQEDFRQQDDWDFGECDVEAVIDCARAGSTWASGSYWDCYYDYCDWDPQMPQMEMFKQIEKCLGDYLKAVEDCSRHCR